MLKKIVMAVVGLVFLSVTVGAFAEDVYVTKRGKKYHRESCPFMENVIKNKRAEKISKEDALAKGRAPCGKCFPEEVSTKAKKLNRENSSTSDQKSMK